MPISDRETLAWAAGLFEGEGSIGLLRPHAAQIQVGMTDKDVVEAFGRAVGIGKLYGPYTAVRNGKIGKPTWRWYISTYEKTQAAVAMLWPWLGARRREQATDVLQAAAVKVPYGFTGRKHTSESRAKITGRPPRTRQ